MSRPPTTSPLGGRVQGADEVEQGRLAATRRPEHDDELARVDDEIDVCECGHGSAADRVTAADPLHLDDGDDRTLLVR